MNNIKKYDEFVNEGLYKFMTKNYYSNEKIPFIVISTFASIFAWIFYFVISGEGETFDSNRTLLLIASLLDSPLIFTTLMTILRVPYDKLRSLLLVGKSSDKYKKAEALITKYPDIKGPLSKIKLEMRSALKNRDKRKISKCIHDIYELSKDLKIREKIVYFLILLRKKKGN